MGCTSTKPKLRESSQQSKKSEEAAMFSRGEDAEVIVIENDSENEENKTAVNAPESDNPPQPPNKPKISEYKTKRDSAEPGHVNEETQPETNAPVEPQDSDINQEYSEEKENVVVEFAEEANTETKTEEEEFYDAHNVPMIANEVDGDNVVIVEEVSDEQQEPEETELNKDDNQEKETVQVIEESNPKPDMPIPIEEKLTKQEHVIYPSAKAALNSRGLQKYAAELEKRGIIEYKDLASLEENLEDPFWSRMPPYPDRKKFRVLIDEVRSIFDALADKEPVDVEKESSVVPESVIQESSEKEKIPEPASEEYLDTKAAVFEVTKELGEQLSTNTNGPRTSIENEAQDDDDDIPPREKTEFPCDTFEADIYAEFGMCTCGHPKKDHNLGAAKTPLYKVGSKTVIQTPIHEVVSGNQSEQRTPVVFHSAEPCSNYRLDMKALTFGTCVCGHPKSEHKQQERSSSNRFKEMAKGSFRGVDKQPYEKKAVTPINETISENQPTITEEQSRFSIKSEQTEVIEEELGNKVQNSELANDEQKPELEVSASEENLL